MRWVALLPPCSVQVPPTYKEHVSRWTGYAKLIMCAWCDGLVPHSGCVPVLYVVLLE